MSWNLFQLVKIYKVKLHEQNTGNTEYGGVQMCLRCAKNNY